MSHARSAATAAVPLLRTLAGLGGLLALRVGCGLANAPLPLGGPMGVSFDAPLGVVMIACGVAVMAFAPARVWRAGWLLAAVAALASAGPNFWHSLPIEDGAFQSLRAGVADPVCWPAPAFLHVFAFAPAGVAIGAVLPGARHPVMLTVASAAAAVVGGLALGNVSDAMPGSAAGTAILVGAAAAATLLVPAAVRSCHPVLRAVAGQAVVLTVLCLVLRLEWSRLV